jgi:hypothetical protein
MGAPFLKGTGSLVPSASELRTHQTLKSKTHRWHRQIAKVEQRLGGDLRKLLPPGA